MVSYRNMWKNDSFIYTYTSNGSVLKCMKKHDFYIYIYIYISNGSIQKYMEKHYFYIYIYI